MRRAEWGVRSAARGGTEWSGLRGSNPSNWLGKPGHYHYAKPARTEPPLYPSRLRLLSHRQRLFNSAGQLSTSVSGFAASAELRDATTICLPSAETSYMGPSPPGAGSD